MGVVVKLFFDGYMRALDQQIEIDLRKAGAWAVPRAYDLAPWRDGDLAKSIDMEVEDGPMGKDLIIFAGIEYAKVQEDRFHYLDQTLMELEQRIGDWL